MNELPDELPHDDDPRLPPGLASDLSRLYSTRVKPSAMVDATIRLTAVAYFHKRFARRRAVRRVVGWSGAVAATAAIVAVGLHFGPWMQNAPVPRHFAMHAVDKDDLNGDGKVDILDAFYLARQLKNGQTPLPAWDVNGDGVVDQRDVDAIALRAVSLQGRGVQ